MRNWIMAAVLVLLTSIAPGEPDDIESPPPGCRSDNECASLCWGAEDVNPWDCFDACLADDDACVE